MTSRRAAFFELHHEYFGRSFDDGIIKGLLRAGYAIDIFAPDGDLPQTLFPTQVQRRTVEYRRRWLQSHMSRRRWRAYDLFLGTCDLPMAFAGALAALAGRPVVTVCDEIHIGGYQGSATGYWDRLARWAMRRAVFTIITDEVRVPLQREYASLPATHEFVQYPCCYAGPYTGRTRAEARQILGIAEDDFVLSSTGAFTQSNGADWIVRLLDDRRVRALIQTAGRGDAVVDTLLERLPGAIYRPQRLEFRESCELTVAADAGAIFYLSRKPQFQAMGVSSSKLCTSLWLGMPVIALRQPSFEFLENYGCGVLISDGSELPAAIDRIRADQTTYSQRAAVAVREYIRPDARMQALAERFERL